MISVAKLDMYYEIYFHEIKKYFVLIIPGEISVSLFYFFVLLIRKYLLSNSQTNISLYRDLLPHGVREWFCTSFVNLQKIMN